jgi:ABC-type transporter Mla subunit MlaD
VDATGIATSTAELSTTLAASLDDVDTALSQVESLAGTIDGALRALSQVPFGPDYDPAVSYPDAISDLRVALEPLDASLRDVAGRLDEFSASSDAAASSLGGLRTDLDEARDALAPRAIACSTATASPPRRRACWPPRAATTSSRRCGGRG